MSRIWLVLLALGLLPSSAYGQQALGPPCDWQNRIHRAAVHDGMAIHDELRRLEQPASRRVAEDAIAALAKLWASLDYMRCAEVTAWALISQSSYVALINELEGASLGFGESDKLAPLLDDWRAWAAGFLAQELQTQFWVGSFDNYRGHGILVGCDSYLLPVDIGRERGRRTAAELSLALSALFDPEQSHPDADVETQDWIKELDLSVASVTIDQGMAEIILDGRLMGIGTCGDAILEAQILQTVFQFDDIAGARISDGARNLREIVDMSDMLSQRERQEYIYERAELDWLRG